MFPRSRALHPPPLHPARQGYCHHPPRPFARMPLSPIGQHPNRPLPLQRIPVSQASLPAIVSLSLFPQYWIAHLMRAGARFTLTIGSCIESFSKALTFLLRTPNPGLPLLHARNHWPPRSRPPLGFSATLEHQRSSAFALACSPCARLTWPRHPRRSPFSSSSGLRRTLSPPIFLACQSAWHPLRDSCHFGTFSARRPLPICHV